MLPDPASQSNSEPPSVSWEAYRGILLAEWRSLLEDTSPTEPEVQGFFERHPCMLPRPYPLFFGGHHGAFPSAVISQPPLHGFTGRVPDFMWIAMDSLNVYAVLIEIETPAKYWFTKKGQQTADLTQAINQLKEWKTWYAQRGNVENFRDFYQLSRGRFGGSNFTQRYVLIYGRRQEATAYPRLVRKRPYLQAEDEFFMTYDRLAPDSELRNYITVKVDERGYRAVQVPPTLHRNLLNAEDWELVRDKDAAVDSNTYLSTERKNFLKQAFTQWAQEMREIAARNGPIPLDVLFE